MTRREKALLRRRIFIACCVAIIAAIAVLITGICVIFLGGDDETEVSEPQGGTDMSADVIVEDEPFTDISSAEEPNESDNGLDPEYSNLLLVNGDNPLPEDYDYEKDLVTIESKYLCGTLNQINADVYPYLTAMLEAAWEDGVDLKVLSPYRSYATQQRLFNNKVNRVIENGTPEERAEAVAATVVARPGTSEHHTGLAVDFNSVEDSFEDTPMYAWLAQNAEDYGFILRYTEEKTSKTGVIHESWHWRFVGINEARKINKSGLCLEEYLEQKN